MNVSNRENINDGLLFPGLDGTNPLGFLAALGLLRIVTEGRPEEQPRMSWQPAMGTWVPCLWHVTDGQKELLDFLEQRLVREYGSHPIGELSFLENKELAGRKKLFRTLVRGRSRHSRVAVDWLAALASDLDLIPPEANNQLQTARRDYFRGNVASVLNRTEREHLERSLFHIWDYADALDNQSLHFDPGEDRRHAHQWNRPSGDPNRKKSGGMLGANRLALEALPIFVSLPEKDRLHTLGFSGFHSDDTRWSWPLWEIPIGLDVVKSLLSIAEIQDLNLSVATSKFLRARGVAAVYRTNRILVGKTPNFTPPQRVA